MRYDLVEELLDVKQITNIIITSFNVDYLYIQSSLIPALNKKDNPKLTIFADYDCATLAFNDLRKYIDGLGDRYRVIPVYLPNRPCFHPKSIFISGEERSKLAIGSGNVGYGGWINNAEIWNIYDTDVNDPKIFNSYRDFITGIIKYIPPNNHVVQEIDEAFDSSTRNWVVEGKLDHSILFSVEPSVNLAKEMIDHINLDFVDKITICSPFYDPKGEAVKYFIDNIKHKEIELLIPKTGSNFSSIALKNLKAKAKIRTITFIREEHEHFIHAKFYAFQTGNTVNLFVGSANCSNAGLCLHDHGNIELLSYQKLDIDTFNSMITNELIIDDAIPELKSASEDNKTSENSDQLRILSCSYKSGKLGIHFQEIDGVVMKQCFIDDIDTKYKEIDTSTIECNPGFLPNYITINGSINGKIIKSLPHWIDNEFHLNANRYNKGFANNIKTRLNTETWDVSVWHYVLNLFNKNINYLPKLNIVIQKSKHEKKNKIELNIRSEDIFTTKYYIPNKIIVKKHNLYESKIRGIQSLILRWFNISADDTTLENSDIDENTAKNKPENKAKDSDKVTQSYKPKISKLLNEIVDTITSTEYILNRPAVYLSSDLSILSILLRLGLLENWIEIKDFIDFTITIWNQFFFASGIVNEETEKRIGLIEHRIVNIDGNEFIDHFKDLKLSASLISWVIFPDDFNTNPELAILKLAGSYSIIMYPWLWYMDDNERLFEEVQKELIYTGKLDITDSDNWNKYVQRINELQELAKVISIIENELSSINPVDLKNNILVDEVHKGDLLWQGGSRGFCISTISCKRSLTSKVYVRCLQHKKGKVPFRSDFLIPVVSILKNEKLLSFKISQSERESLIDTIENLSLK